MQEPSEITFSFIIPVYNTPAELLRECLEGICGAGEVILIDDGSTDRAVLEYLSAQRDRRGVRLLRQENQGVSAARNAGIEAAQGDYIVFADADDLIDRALFQEAAEFVKQDPETEVFCFTYQTVDGKGKLRERGKATREAFHISSFAELKHSERADRSWHLNGGVVWAKIYRKDVLSDVRFETDVCFAEDGLFNFVLGQRIAKICCIALPWYSYRINALSVGHRYDPHVQDKFARTYAKMKEIYTAAGLSLPETDLYPTAIFCYYLEYTLSIAVYHPQNKMSRREKQQLALGILRSEPFAEALAALDECRLSKPQRMMLSRLKKGRIKSARRLFLLKQKILKILYR